MNTSEEYWDERWQELINEADDIEEKVHIEKMREKWRKVAFPKDDLEEETHMEFVKRVLGKYA